MRNKRSSDRLSWLLFALTTAAVSMAVAEEQPQEWLERMNHALTTRNYDGVFSHWQGGKVETLRIIHRVQNGAVTERLLSLDGSGREFIRSGSELACYLPDQRTVVVEKRPEHELLLGGLPKFNAGASQYYEITGLKPTRLLGREARLISIRSKDEFRYGYRLWIDESTAMPLKTQLCDSRGRIIEQVVFASLTLPAHIPDTAFKPDISTEGFQWLRNEPGVMPSTGAPPAALWSALRLPPGFRMSARGAQVMPGSTDPVAHLVFTDGVASVSVFVETRQKRAAEPTMSGTTQVGSSSAFSTVIDGHQVTAVGEVPPATVRFIARSVKAQEGSAPPTSAPPMGAPALRSPSMEAPAIPVPSLQQPRR